MLLKYLVPVIVVYVLQMEVQSTSAAFCPGSAGVRCDGCQCCPNGCLCPNAQNCPNPHMCPVSGDKCGKATTKAPKPTKRPTVAPTKAPTKAPETTSTEWRTTHHNEVPTETMHTGHETVKTTKGPHPGTFATTTAAPGTLIFDDEFDFLDFSRWKHELTMGGGGNWEFEMYHNNRSNSYTREGILYIKPGLTADFLGGEQLVKSGASLDMWGSTPADLCTGNMFYGCKRTAGAGGNYLNPITSARLRTAEYFSFRYGRVEVRAKLPRGDWLWPAIWMLPRDNEYGNWPASGEIDICESRGNIGYPAANGGGPETFGTTLHFGPSYQQDPFQKAHATYSLPTGTFNDDFHTFGFVWTADRMYSYVDTESNIVMDLPIKEDFWKLGNFPSSYANPWANSPNKNAPFDKQYYLILNIAVGGTSGYFPDGVGGKPWTNNDGHAVNSFYNAKGQWYSTWDQTGEESALQVDSVKVWAL